MFELLKLNSWRLLSVIASFAQTLFLANILDQSDFGVFYFSLSLVIIFSSVIKGGGFELILRHPVPLSNLQLWNYLKQLAPVVTTIFLVLGLILFLINYQIQRFDLDSLFWIVASATLLALSSLLWAALRSRGKQLMAQNIEFISRPLIFTALGLIVSAGFIQSFNDFALPICFILVFALSLYNIIKTGDEAKLYKDIDFCPKQFLIIGIGSTVLFANGFFDLIMVNIFFGNVVSAEYKVVHQICSLITIPTTVISLHFFSKASQDRSIYSDKKAVCRFLLLATCAVFFTLFIIIAFRELSIWRSVFPKYEIDLTLLFALAIGQMANGVGMILTSYFTVIYKESMLLMLSVFSLLINIIVSLVLMPTYGAIAFGLGLMCSFCFLTTSKLFLWLKHSTYQS